MPSKIVRLEIALFEITRSENGPSKTRAVQIASVVQFQLIKLSSYAIALYISVYVYLFIQTSSSYEKALYISEYIYSDIIHCVRRHCIYFSVHLFMCRCIVYISVYIYSCVVVFYIFQCTFIHVSLYEIAWFDMPLCQKALYKMVS